MRIANSSQDTLPADLILKAQSLLVATSNNQLAQAYQILVVKWFLVQHSGKNHNYLTWQVYILHKINNDIVLYTTFPVWSIKSHEDNSGQDTLPADLVLKAQS